MSQKIRKLQKRINSVFLISITFFYICQEGSRFFVVVQMPSLSNCKLRLNFFQSKFFCAQSFIRLLTDTQVNYFFITENIWNSWLWAKQVKSKLLLFCFNQCSVSHFGDETFGLQKYSFIFFRNSEKGEKGIKHQNRLYLNSLQFFFPSSQKGRLIAKQTENVKRMGGGGEGGGQKIH